MQRGGRSKDAWVLWDGAVDKFSMLRPRHQPVPLQHTPADIPSRAADHLFWLGRYAERCECIARLLRCLMTRVRRATEPSLPACFACTAASIPNTAFCPKDRPATARDLETSSFR